ncbi:DUF1073 domain-containing protein [bacterium]|nr:DUF1073 domain-containing protein [bacterium]
MTDYTEDSATLMNVYGSISPTGNGYRGSISSIHNRMTGLNTERDPSNYVGVNNFSYTLTPGECIELYKNSNIVQNVVNTYPMESKFPHFQFSGYSYRATSKEVNNFFETRLNESLHQTFIEASIEARLIGKCWLLLGVTDGRKMSEPVDETNIISFDWTKIRTSEQVSLASDKTGNYLVTLDEGNLYLSQNKIEVHPSRLLSFTGNFSPISMKRAGKDANYSVIQSMYDGFALYMQSLLYTNRMVADYSLFYYKLKGLAQLVQQKKTDTIYSRFTSLSMSRSAMGGFCMDMDNEDIGFIHRDYGGVDKIIDRMEDFMIAETGMVRYKIVGSSNRVGLGAEGRGLQERLAHSQNTTAWVNFNWKKNLLYCTRLYLLSQNGITRGKLPKSITLNFPSNLELTPDETSSLQNQQADYLLKLLGAGLITKSEARETLYEFNPILNFSLDESFSQKIKDEILVTNIQPAEITEDSEEDEEKIDEERPEPKKFDSLLASTRERLKLISNVSQSDIDKVVSELNGRTANQLAREVDRLTESNQNLLKNYVSQLFDGEISIDEFMLKVANNLKDIHILQAIRGNNRVELADKGKRLIASNLADQFYAGKEGKDKFGLVELAKDMTREVTPGEISKRVGMFGQSGKISRLGVEMQNQIDSGVKEGLRILGASDMHCPECIEYAARGWQSLDKVILPTQGCSCKTNCQCSMIYR